jgi:hypothetical protein
MTLLHHRRTAPRTSAPMPFWSLELPRWAAAGGTQPRLAPEPERATWTCARCGTVLNSTSAAAEHIELHRPQARPRPASVHRSPKRARGNRHSPFRVAHKGTAISEEQK